MACGVELGLGNSLFLMGTSSGVLQVLLFNG